MYTLVAAGGGEWETGWECVGGGHGGGVCMVVCGGWVGFVTVYHTIQPRTNATKSEPLEPTICQRLAGRLAVRAEVGGGGLGDSAAAVGVEGADGHQGGCSRAAQHSAAGQMGTTVAAAGQHSAAQQGGWAPEWLQQGSAPQRGAAGWMGTRLRCSRAAQRSRAWLPKRLQRPPHNPNSPGTSLMREEPNPNPKLQGTAGRGRAEKRKQEGAGSSVPRQHPAAPTSLV